MSTAQFLKLDSVSLRIDSTPNSASREMNFEDLDSDGTKCVNLRLCNVSGCMTEILEIHADQPSLHVVFVPGNPGAITFYKEFVESLFDFLGGTASLLSYVSDQLLAPQVIQKRIGITGGCIPCKNKLITRLSSSKCKISKPL
ncbi:hypothetical protein V6N13_148686 [Hibiscus sabdariffa]